MPTPCQPRVGDATLLAQGPQPPLPASRRAAAGGHSRLQPWPLSGAACAAPTENPAAKRLACPPLGGGTAAGAERRGGTRIRDLNGSAEPQCSLCRRRRVGTAVATSPASMTSASQSGAVPDGDEAARIPRRASVRAPAIPHQPRRTPGLSQERCNGCRRACGIRGGLPRRHRLHRGDTRGDPWRGGARSTTPAGRPAARRGRHVSCFGKRHQAALSAVRPDRDSLTSHSDSREVQRALQRLRRACARWAKAVEEGTPRCGVRLKRPPRH